MRTILAIDPGRDKCGLAVVLPGRVLRQQVTPRADAPSAVANLVAEYGPDEIIIGNGTGSTALVAEIGAVVSVPLRAVEEAHTSERARTRFFIENPPRGFRRFIPRGLLIPDRPYDDYVAVILAEDYLSTSGE